MNANDALRSSMVRHQIHIQRYSAGVSKKVVDLLRKMDADIIAQITRVSMTPSTSPLTVMRLNALLSETRALIEEVHRQSHDLVREEAGQLVEYESQFQRNLITSSLHGVVPVAAPDLNLLRAAIVSEPFEGRLLKEWFDGLAAGTVQQVKGAIRMGVAEGQTIEQMVSRVRGTRALGFKDGVLSMRHRSAEAVVRTAVNHVVNVARNETYKENSALIKGVQWVSTLDARTSDICQSLDGKVFPLDSGPRPPAHINCRSSTTPVLKSWRELGIDLDEMPESTRASVNGQVPASETYQSWLSKQPADFQDEVLGPSRGRLLRSGGLSVDRFVDENTGHRYTLSELRARDRKAFNRAGL